MEAKPWQTEAHAGLMRSLPQNDLRRDPRRRRPIQPSPASVRRLRRGGGRRRSRRIRLTRAPGCSRNPQTRSRTRSQRSRSRLRVLDKGCGCLASTRIVLGRIFRRSANVHSNMRRSFCARKKARLRRSAAPRRRAGALRTRSLQVPNDRAADRTRVAHPRGQANNVETL